MYFLSPSLFSLFGYIFSLSLPPFICIMYFLSHTLPHPTLHLFFVSFISKQITNGLVLWIYYFISYAQWCQTFCLVLSILMCRRRYLFVLLMWYAELWTGDIDSRALFLQLQHFILWPIQWKVHYFVIYNSIFPRNRVQCLDWWCSGLGPEGSWPCSQAICNTCNEYPYNYIKFIHSFLCMVNVGGLIS